jgi:hypothetical protein
MPTMVRASTSGPHAARPGAGKVYRGSRKRLKRVKWRENTPIEFWVLVALLLVALFVIIPWMIRHTHHH